MSGLFMQQKFFFRGRQTRGNDQIQKNFSQNKIKIFWGDFFFEGAGCTPDAGDPSFRMHRRSWPRKKKRGCNEKYFENIFSFEI